MSDVHRWDCDCEFHNPDWTADKISVVRASDFDALRAERDRLAEALDRALDSLRIVGDDYPGSNCQRWCHNRIFEIRAAELAEQETKR